jgi:hypothetical protein
MRTSLRRRARLLLPAAAALATFSVAAEAHAVTYTVSNPTVNETTAPDPDTSATFTITRDSTIGAAEVTATTVGETATAPQDFEQKSGPVEFVNGQETAQVVVIVKRDALDEADETFRLELSGLQMGDTATPGRATIIDDDASPTLTIGDVSSLEGTSAAPARFLTFQLALNTASGRPVTADIDTAAITAVGAQNCATTGADYVNLDLDVTFNPGQTTQTASVQVCPDSFDEPDETLELRATNVSGAVPGDFTGVGTITDDDDSLRVVDSNNAEPGDVTVTEGTGSAAGGIATFTIGVDKPDDGQPLGREVTVNYATVNGTATAPADFTSTSGTATIPADDMDGRVTVDVPIAGDTTDENDESFQLQLSSPQNATIADGSGVATIIDDDDPPTVSVADASNTEGTGANRFVTFTVSLSAPSGKFVTVNYETAPGTALVPDATTTPQTTGDFQPRTGTLTFSPGLTSQTVSVTIISDSIDEANETFELRLKTDVVNTSIADGVGIGTIIDDDGPQVNVADATVDPEGAAGTTRTTDLTVTLSSASPQDVTLDAATANDTATQPDDYVPLPSGTKVTIPAGATTGKVTITTKGDDLDENDEKVRVTLTNPVNASLVDGIGVATIVDDDASPTLQIDDVSVNEGTGGSTSAKLDIRLSAPSGKTLLAGYATQDGTATVAQPDYQQGSELLTFNPGDTVKSVSIPVAADAELEADETFLVQVFGSGGTTNQLIPVTVTIVDDDLTAANSPRLSPNDVTVQLEGGPGTQQPATFTVTMDRTIPRVVAVDFAVEGRTATIPEDLLPSSGRLTFAPGEKTQTIPVTINGDAEVESNHDFRVRLANPTNARIQDDLGVGIIIDDDAGGGSITLGSTSVRERDLLCRRRGACRGLPLRWNVAVTGSMLVAVRGRYTTGRGAKRRTQTLRLFRNEFPVAKSGAGQARVRARDSKFTRQARDRVRRLRISQLEVIVRFRNALGAEQVERFPVRLRR